MKTASLVDRLSEVPLFEGVPKKTLKLIANVIRDEHFSVGDEIVKEGATDGRFYLVEDGEAEVTVGGKVVRHIGPGDHFGELSLIDRRPRSATVRATTPLRAYSLMRVHAREVLRDPVVLERILVNVSGWLREAQSLPLA